MLLTSRALSSPPSSIQISPYYANISVHRPSLSAYRNGHLFAYTSERYVFNETLWKNERYVTFDVEDFKKLAETHIRHGRVADISKNFPAIAKTPYRTTLPKHYATASEAATLELLRLKGIPVPKDFGYSASSDNLAGVEYITMEKAQGIQVKDKWFPMTKQGRHKLASSFVGIEKALSSLPFSSIESVYFKRDIPAELQAPLHSRVSQDQGHVQEISNQFCVGPITDYIFWYGKRAKFQYQEDHVGVLFAKNANVITLTRQTDELYRRMLMFHYYHIFTGVLNNPRLNALRDPLLKPRKHRVDGAGRQWGGNTITLKGALVRIADYWDQLPETKGIECPVKLDILELEEFLKLEEIWHYFNAVVNHWRDKLGIGEDGWVSSENYGSAMKGIQELKQDMINKAEGDEEDIFLINKGWPLDDHEEID
ncbi:hypothetical protein McanCB21832_007828 [Microsporum canis]